MPLVKAGGPFKIMGKGKKQVRVAWPMVQIDEELYQDMLEVYTPKEIRKLIVAEGVAAVRNTVRGILNEQER